VFADHCHMMTTAQIHPRPCPPAKRRRIAGLTLIELLVVTAIIAILATMTFPAAKRMIAASHTANPDVWPGSARIWRDSV
jgi:prepilin-type N-terminal cleavage/methylation domain-containing protein